MIPLFKKNPYCLPGHVFMGQNFLCESPSFCGVSK